VQIKEDTYFYINTQGKRAFQGDFLDADPFSEGYAVVTTKSGGDQETVIGADGSTLAARHAIWYSFQGGLLPFYDVKERTLIWGFLDPKGVNHIIEGADELRVFSEGFAAFEVLSNDFPQGRWGYLDTQFQIVMPLGPEGTWRGDFHNGRAAIHDHEGFGFIDKTGKLAFPDRYESARRFRDGLARVSQKDWWGYIDTSGKVVWKSAPGEPFPEQLFRGPWNLP
jgi:hypothetical protein